MSGTALAVTVLVAATLLLGVITFSLGRQVRGLRSEVERLGRSREVSGAAGEASVDPAVDPAVDAARDVEATEVVAVPPMLALEEIEVLTPTPIGPAEAELDLSVSRVASVTLAGPLIKVAAFSHGVRRALGEESRLRVAYAFRKELRRQRKLRRKRAAGRPPGMPGGRP